MQKNHARIILSIAVPVAIIALGIWFVQHFFRSTITSYVENTLEKEIGNHFHQSSGDVLHIDIQKLKFNAFPITISTPGISLYAESDEYNKEGSALPTKYVYEAGVINLEISLKPLVFIALGQKEFSISRFRADSVYFSTKTLSQTPGEDMNSLRKILSGPIRFEGTIELPDENNEGIENIQFERHALQAANISAAFPEDLYSYHIESVSFDGTMNTINLEKIKIIPNYSKEVFYQHVDFETDRIETHLENVEIMGLQTHKKQGRTGLMVSRINIRNGIVDVFRDRRPPFNEEQRPAMPVKLIMAAPLDLFVAGINISDTDILYSEFPDNDSEAGFHEAAGNIPFYRLEASVKNITNIADSLQSDSIMEIVAEAHIFDGAILRADFKYNLNDNNGGYTAEVELSEFPFESINPALYPLAGIEVLEGIHKSSAFAFTGNDVESMGALYMEWSDLSLDFTPEAGDVITDIAQSLGKIIYHQSNPNDVTNNPSGEIFFERDIRRFVFHYWWNCYLSGIKNSVVRDFVPL